MSISNFSNQFQTYIRNIFQCSSCDFLHFSIDDSTASTISLGGHEKTFRYIMIARLITIKLSAIELTSQSNENWPQSHLNLTPCLKIMKIPSQRLTYVDRRGEGEVRVKLIKGSKLTFGLWTIWLHATIGNFKQLENSTRIAQGQPTIGIKIQMRTVYHNICTIFFLL